MAGCGQFDMKIDQKRLWTNSDQFQSLQFIHYQQLMSELFKLFPENPTIQSKLLVFKDTNSRQSIHLTVLGWHRILPNKKALSIECRDPIAYQCTGLDNSCTIQASISYKINDKVYNKFLYSGIVSLTQDLVEKSLYVAEPVRAKVCIEGFEVPMNISVVGKNITFISEVGKFNGSINENLIEVQQSNCMVKCNYVQLRTDFLKFYSDSLKFVPKVRSNFCVLKFNSKFEQNSFLVAISQSFVESPSKVNSQIKILGSRNTRTPRNEKQLKNDGSTSSLASNNKNRSQNKIKEKVKISEKIQEKKINSKVHSHIKLNSQNSNTNSNKQYLNIFQEDLLDRGEEQPSTAKQSDLSMDLRGSFEQLEKTNKDDDNLSNHSFRQKSPKGKYSPLQQENKKLKQENWKLKKQLQILSQESKQMITLRKKYNNAVQQLGRLEGERIALIKDKVKFQSAFYEERAQKEKLKKELDKFLKSGK